MITETPSLWVYPDGREHCRPTPEGKAEYARRRSVALTDQEGRCAICYKALPAWLATTDHREPRGMGGGTRDDRQGNIQAVCWGCNSEKASRRDYR
ncbi:MAG: HNH endonuclease signature motif containing protein [Terriglobales bacterium]